MDKIIIIIIVKILNVFTTDINMIMTVNSAYLGLISLSMVLNIVKCWNNSENILE